MQHKVNTVDITVNIMSSKSFNKIRPFLTVSGTKKTFDGRALP